jgi:hypothetical protein
MPSPRSSSGICAGAGTASAGPPVLARGTLHFLGAPQAPMARNPPLPVPGYTGGQGTAGQFSGG